MTFHAEQKIKARVRHIIVYNNKSRAKSILRIKQKRRGHVKTDARLTKFKTKQRMTDTARKERQVVGVVQRGGNYINFHMQLQQFCAMSLKCLSKDSCTDC